MHARFDVKCPSVLLPNQQEAFLTISLNNKKAAEKNGTL
jgi:hypothetical protein